MRKSPLRLFSVALIHMPGCVAHQYGVTMAIAPQQEAGSENQISTHHHAWSHCRIWGLNVLNYVVLHSSGFILGLIFSICKMRRVPIKSAVRSHELLEWMHIIIWKALCNWEPLQDLQSEFGAELSLTGWHLKSMRDYKPKENIYFSWLVN